MIEAQGKFLRQTSRAGFVAGVTVQVESDPTGPHIHFHCTGVGFRSQGDIEEAPAEGYTDWKQGAEAGARYALQLANQEQFNVRISQILGITADTNPTIVGAAAMRAVWQALNYTPLSTAAERIEQIVLASWQHPGDYIPDFCLNSDLSD